MMKMINEKKTYSYSRLFDNEEDEKMIYQNVNVSNNHNLV